MFAYSIQVKKKTAPRVQVVKLFAVFVYFINLLIEVCSSIHGLGLGSVNSWYVSTAEGGHK
jgi:hypothetical protein